MQGLVGRVTDRRLITYGVNPQAQVRAENAIEGGAPLFDVVFRGAEMDAASPVCTCPWPGRITWRMPWPPRPWRASWTPRTRRSRRAWRVLGVKRRFTKAGVERRPHRRRLWAPSGRDRRGPEGPRGRSPRQGIAVIQPHRYTRLRDLMEEVSTSLTDADTAFIADIYPAGEAPSRGLRATR